LIRTILGSAIDAIVGSLYREREEISREVIASRLHTAADQVARGHLVSDLEIRKLQESLARVRAMQGDGKG
jgi:hypothetical protein